MSASIENGSPQNDFLKNGSNSLGYVSESTIDVE
jgi:hypothetical protein